MDLLLRDDPITVSLNEKMTEIVDLIYDGAHPFEKIYYTEYTSRYLRHIKTSEEKEQLINYTKYFIGGEKFRDEKSIEFIENIKMKIIDSGQEACLRMYPVDKNIIVKDVVFKLMLEMLPDFKLDYSVLPKKVKDIFTFSKDVGTAKFFVLFDYRRGTVDLYLGSSSPLLLFDIGNFFGIGGFGRYNVFPPNTIPDQHKKLIETTKKGIDFVAKVFPFFIQAVQDVLAKQQSHTAS